MKGNPRQITRDMTMGEALACVVERFPRRIAIVCGSERVRYEQLAERARALAYHLRLIGVGPGVRVATLLWSVPEFIYTFFAVSLLGGVISPLPARLRRHQMEEFLRELEPRVVVTFSDLDVADGLHALAALKHELPGEVRVLIVDDERNAPPFGDLLALPPGAEFQAAAVSPKDLLAILYTSGTTGRAKGVMHSHRGLVAPVVASIKLREMWMTFIPTPRRLRRWVGVLVRYGSRLLRVAGKQQVFLSTMAPHTISGIEAMLQALLMGDRLVLLPRFHPVHALEAIEKERVTVLIGVPLNFAMMMRTADFDKYRKSSLLICGAGAAPCPPDLARQIQRRFGCAVHIGFGMTELGGGIAATMLDDSAERQAETVGRAMPGMEVLVLDDAGKPLPAGQIGELACRTESQMVGYFGEAHEQTVPDREDGFFRTGDLAVVDEAGFIRIVGRKKDVIIRGGQNIHPGKIENLLMGLSGVQEVAVVGVADELGVERVWAFVILETGAEVTERGIIGHCRAHLEAFEIPEQVRIVNDFPRTSMGKPQKFKLQEMAMEAWQKRNGRNERNDVV